MPLTTDYLIIGKSGKTIDGRTITEQMLTDMAETYDKSVYTALLWPDHSKYVNYGVVEDGLRTQKLADGSLVLQAKISPNSFLINDNRYGQNLFLSMEVTQNFAGTGKYYLSGLAVTDSPASLGTSQIKLFNNQSNSPLLFSESIQAESKSLHQKTGLFNLFKREDASMDKATLEAIQQGFSDLKQEIAKFNQNPIDPPPANPKEKPESNAQDFTTIKTGLAAMETQFKTVAEQQAKDTEKLASIEQKFTALSEKLDAALKEADSNGTHPPNHTGADEFKQEDYL